MELDKMSKKMKKNNIYHNYSKIVSKKNDVFLYVDEQNEIFDEFGNYKMPNHFESNEINSTFQKHE